jgi:hypothetical protein
MRDGFKENLTAFLLSLRASDARRESRVGMSPQEIELERRLHKRESNAKQPK